jgi:sulfate transport system substrate-binding protein
VGHADTTILNASYDVTREFYQAYNTAFVAHWKAQTGETLTVNQSHNGSSKQARAVIDGLEADVVTMNQSTDIDILADKNLVPAEWNKLFPENAAPYTSTILFLVRKGNPKGIKDWNDLVRDDVEVIIPNPKLSGNGRYSYIAAWGYALKQSGGDEAKAKEFVRKFIANVPVLDGGGRAATMTFVQRNIGDVLLTFENEVHGTLKELGDKFEVVVPSVSILAESPVAVVGPVAEKRGTQKVAKAYLDYLYSEKGQEIIAAHYFRPRSKAVLKANSNIFPELKLLTIDEVAGGWAKALKVHFSDGGIFDQIYTKK